MNNMENLSLKSPTRVHIIPVGNERPERVIKPALFLKPERIYLFTISGADAFKQYYNDIRNNFKEYLKDSDKNLIESVVNYYDLEEFLGKIHEICNLERQRNSEIWMNISGGTMLSVVGTLAAIYYKINPYFAKHNYLTDKVEEGALFPPIPNYPIQKPDEKIIKLLQYMKVEMDISPEKRVAKKKCIDLIKDNAIDTDFTGSHTSIYNKLNNRYLNPLSEWGFIKIYQSTHSDIEITQEGFFAIKMFGQKIK